MALTQVSSGGIKNATVATEDIANGAVSNAKIVDGAINNAKVVSDAAIAGSKINPSFTSNLTITNTQPKIFLTDSNNTSDFSIQNENGNLNFYDETNSVSRVRIVADGKIGIGTTSPDNTLHLLYSDSQTYNTDIRNAGLQIENNDGTDNTYAQLHLRAGNSDAYLRAIREGSNLTSLAFLTDNGGSTSDAGEAMRIDSSGRVGIGTTSPTSTGIQSGVKTVQIDGGDGAELILGNSVSQNVSSNHIGAIVFKNIDTSTGNAPHYAGIRSNCVDTSGNMNLKFYTGTTRFEADSPDMLIDANGKVGIGKSPSHKLDISQDGGTFPSAAGSTVLRLSNSAGSTTLSIDANAGNVSAIQFGDTDASSRGTVLYNHSSDHLQFNTVDTERMRINSNGDIMAGRTSVFSGARLSLEKSGTCLGIRQAANADNNSIEMTHVFATSGSTNAFQISFRDASGNQRGSITNTTSTTSYNTSSDYRLKENEVLISDGITRLKTLKPYKFNWKAEPSTIVDGFFAHEVSDAVPEAVIGEKDASIGEDGKGYQQIDHSKLVPLLVAAVQELIGKVEVLEAA